MPKHIKIIMLLLAPLMIAGVITGKYFLFDKKIDAPPQESIQNKYDSKLIDEFMELKASYIKANSRAEKDELADMAINKFNNLKNKNSLPEYLQIFIKDLMYNRKIKSEAQGKKN